MMAKYPQPKTLPYFYMSPYIIDIVCIVNPFLGVGWSWNEKCPPIQVYCKNMWEHKYMCNYG
jgi:hypothetical protein